MTSRISNFGFIILNPDRNIKYLANTIESIKTGYPEMDYISVVPDAKISDFSPYCKTYKAPENTYSSMINTALKNSKYDWNIIILAGSWVKQTLNNIQNNYIKSEDFVLFPVPRFKTEVKKDSRFDKASFCQGSINGIFIHKNAAKKLGEMPSSPTIQQPETLSVNDFELIKLEWSYSGISKGIKFVPLFGISIC